MTVTDALLSEGKESRANLAKTGFMQNAKVSLTQNKTMQEIVWICSYCAEGRKEDTLELKLFKRYVDDIVCTVKGNSLDYLGYANSLHKNLQFTLETSKGSGDLAFLDLNINLNEDRISCHRHQKSTDTDIILNFRSCAPLQHKRNAIQWTVHRIFKATSDWQSFDVAPKKIKRSGLKINTQRSGPPVLLMGRWIK